MTIVRGEPGDRHQRMRNISTSIIGVDRSKTGEAIGSEIAMPSLLRIQSTIYSFLQVQSLWVFHSQHEGKPAFIVNGLA